MGNVNQCVLIPLETVYGPPRTDNEALFYDLWEDGLQTFTDDQLDAGVKALIKERESPFWPTLAEVIRFCRTTPTSSNQVHFSAYSDEPERKFTPASAEEKARVQAMVNDLNSIIAKQVEEKLVTAPKGIYHDRRSFEEMQRNSPNIDLMMTEHGKAKFRETGRKPEHPKPKLLETDTFKEADRLYEQQHGKKAS